MCSTAPSVSGPLPVSSHSSETPSVPAIAMKTEALGTRSLDKNRPTA